MTDRPDDEIVDAELVDEEAAPEAGHDPPPSPILDTGYTPAGVPTFDHVRETIEGRIATAGGAEELDRGIPEVRSLEQQEAERDAAGRDRLEQIRRTMRGDG